MKANSCKLLSAGLVTPQDLCLPVTNESETLFWILTLADLAMDLQLLSPFIQLVTNAAPRLKYGMALAWEQQLRAFEPDAFGHKITDAVAEQYRKAKWLLPMQVTCQAWRLLDMLHVHALTA